MEIPIIVIAPSKRTKWWHLRDFRTVKARVWPPHTTVLVSERISEMVSFNLLETTHVYGPVSTEIRDLVNYEAEGYKVPVLRRGMLSID